MTRTIVHIERKSRFLRALLPINPSEDIRFGTIDCISIGAFLISLAGMICTLAT